jgi:hypothetical protein
VSLDPGGRIAGRSTDGSVTSVTPAVVKALGSTGSG